MVIPYLLWADGSKSLLLFICYKIEHFNMNYYYKMFTIDLKYSVMTVLHLMVQYKRRNVISTIQVSPVKTLDQ